MLSWHGTLLNDTTFEMFKGFFIARNAGLFVCKKFVTTKGILSNVWLRYMFNIINKIHPNYVIDHYASTTFLRVKIMN